MDVTAVLNTLLHGNQLKRTARTGWAQRGVPNAENVAAHSFGVVFVALCWLRSSRNPSTWVKRWPWPPCTIYPKR